jgi:predicted permease
MDAYGEIVTADCLTVMGITTAMGRWFEPAETPLTGSGKPVVVITDRMWERMFDRAPDVLTRTIRIQGMHMVVIGVMHAGYTGFSPEYAVDFIVPFNSHRTASGAIAFIARLHDSATIDQLRAQVRLLWPAMLDAVVPQGPARAQLIKERSGDAESYAGGASVLRRLYATPVRNMSILSAGLILLVCVNVGGLLLARVSGRSHELAAMRALGASSLRLSRPLVAEGVLYAIGGAALGVPLAYAESAAFTRLLPWANLPWSIDMTPDARVLGGIVAAVVALAFGISLMPVWFASRRSSLHRTDRTVTRATNRWAQALLVGQVAVTVVLVFSGGLVIRSFSALWSADRGYQSEGVLSMRLVPNPGGYEKFDQPPYYTTLIERLAALPGVESAGLARYFGTINTQLTPAPVAFVGTDATASAVMEFVSPKFFETVRIPILRGRDVSWSDLPSTPKVVLVSESLARALSPDGEVVGRVIKYGTDPAMSQLQIIGVAGNISLGNLRQNDVRLVYSSAIQAGQATYATVQLRMAGDPMALARPATEVIESLGREHVQRAVPVDFLFSNSVVAERMATVAGGVAAFLALVIACVGLFALLAHSVERRRREIGIRIAVGATPKIVSTLIIRDALVVVVLGLMTGIPAAIAASSLVRSLLYGVSGTDFVTVIASGSILIATSAVAAALPALRAVRVDPTTALRAE